jgi:RimJ/RimL family protein N-acetyltransferase
MGDGVLETERLILRPAAADDLPWILESMNTAAVLRYLGGTPRSSDAVAEGLASDIAAFGVPGKHRRWTAFLREGDRRIGRLGLFPVHSDAAPPIMGDQPEIGWMLAEEHWGRGYAAEAAREVLRFAFGPLAQPLVWSQTSESNVSSTRMMHSLGFTARPELGYVDPDYPAADNPTTVWSLDRETFAG